MTTLGQLLRERREKRGVSLREMARWLKVSAPYLSDVERDRRGLPWDRLAVFADAYGLSRAPVIRASGHCAHCYGTGKRRA